jgi:hypothetical protein
MQFTEDLDLFFADFGKPVTAGAVSGLGILESSGEYIHNARAIDDHPVLRCQTSQFGSLGYKSSLTYDGQNYLVLEKPMPIDDGQMCLVLLERVTAPPAAAENLTTISGVNITTILGVPLLALP